MLWTMAVRTTATPLQPEQQHQKQGRRRQQQQQPTTDGCYTSTDPITAAELVVNDTSIAREYIICPNTTIEIGVILQNGTIIGETPLFVQANATVRCGNDGARSNNCVISAGQVGIVLAEIRSSAQLGDILNIQSTRFEGITLSDFFGSAIFSFGVVGDVTFEDCAFLVSTHGNSDEDDPYHYPYRGSNDVPFILFLTTRSLFLGHTHTHTPNMNYVPLYIHTGLSIRNQHSNGWRHSGCRVRTSPRTFRGWTIRGIIAGTTRTRTTTRTTTRLGLNDRSHKARTNGIHEGGWVRHDFPQHLWIQTGQPHLSR